MYIDATSVKFRLTLNADDVKLLQAIVTQHPPTKEGGTRNFFWIDVDASASEDDKLETVKQRISVYEKQTQPLVDYYRQLGLLVEIDGNQSIAQVTEDLVNLLGMVAEING